MNWLAKINIKTAIKHFGAFRSALFIIFIIVTCFYSGYRVGNYYHDFQIDTLAKQKERLEKLYKTQVVQVRRIHSLEVELEIERMASQRSQAMLKAIEQEHFQVKKQLAFYEKVMAPEKQADGLAIDYIKVNALESANHYQFQVALVQQQLKKRYAKGYIEISFSGSLKNKPNKVSLQQISTITKKNLSFSFKYFQIISGEFTLPTGFMPEKIHLSAILPKGRWQKYHKLDKAIVWSVE